MKAAWSSALAAALVGCAAAPVDPAVDRVAREPLYCTGAEQCSIYWRRAQVWVATNSKWKIQNATDAVITTFTPRDGDVSYGYQVVRIPQSDGREHIRIYPSCANMFGCKPQEAIAAASFKAFVKAGDR